MSRTKGFALCVLFALFGCTPEPAVQCAREWVCIEVVEQHDSVQIGFHNRRPYPVVLRLRLWGENIEVTPAPDRVLTLAGGTQLWVAKAQAAQRQQAWEYRYQYHWVLGRLDAKHEQEYLYRLPFAVGRQYPVLQGFNGRYSHQGLDRYAVDFDVPEGTAIHAARAGVVADLENRQRGFDPTFPCESEANYVAILHNDGTTSEYYHLQYGGVRVTLGQRVARGQFLGLSGNTGCSNQPHLHFAVYRATPEARSQSLPIRFRTQQGVIDSLRHGDRYRVSD